MTDHLALIMSTAIRPGLALLPPAMDTREAHVEMLAIGLQESRFTARRQHPIRPGMPYGPANGFWQFERGGGVKGVLLHRASRDYARIVCDARGVNSDARSVWEALAEDDVLAAAFSRLLLFTDPKPLPAIGAEYAAWQYYLRNWRPGKPHRQTWGDCYAKAVRAAT
jgi:hypothetical protein